MTSNDCRSGQNPPRTEQGPRHGLFARQKVAPLLGVLVLAVLVVLLATACGHHFHVTYHAAKHAGSRVTSESGR